MDALFLLLNCANKDFSSLFEQSLEDVMRVVEYSTLNPSSDASGILYRVLHRTFTDPQRKSYSYLTITHILQIMVYLSLTTFPSILPPTLFKHNPHLSLAFPEFTKKSCVMLTLLVAKLESQSGSKRNGKSSLSQKTNASGISTQSLVFLSQLVNAHTLILPFIMDTSPCIPFCSLLITNHPKLLNLQSIYTSTSPFNAALTLFLSTLYSYINDVLYTTSEEVSEAVLSGAGPSFTVAFHEQYPPLPAQYESILACFPNLAISHIKNALKTHKTVEAAVEYLFCEQDAPEEVCEAIPEPRRNVFEDTPLEIVTRTHIPVDTTQIINYCDDLDDTYDSLPEAVTHLPNSSNKAKLDNREHVLRDAVVQGVFELKVGDKRRVEVQKACQMDDALMDAWYKMYLRGGGVGSEFAGNIRKGKSGWGGEVDDEEEKSVPGMRGYTSNARGDTARSESTRGESTRSESTRGESTRGDGSGRGRGSLRRGDRKRGNSKKHQI